jgi:outer membrane protein assembly factor BamB
MIVLATMGLATTGCTQTEEPVTLGPKASSEPADSQPWALTPTLAEGDTLISVNNLMDVASEGMWAMGAGIHAFDLTTGERIWHLDYSNEVFEVDPSSLPTEVNLDAISNGEGKLAAMLTSMYCPDDECTGEETEEFTLVTLDTATGAILGSLTGTGAFPTIAAFAGDVVVYGTDWEAAIAYRADGLSGDPLWSSPTFDLRPDAQIDGAMFTAIPEDVTGGLGWVNIADGTPAPYTIDLDAYQSFFLASPEEAIVTWGEGEDHVVESIDPTTSDLHWQASVPATEDENENLQVTSTRVVVSFDTDDGYRTTALNRENGEEAWSLADGSAGQVNDQWALIDNAETASTWKVLNIGTGAEVSQATPPADSILSVQLRTDSMLVAGSGKLESRSLVGAGAGADTPVWSIDTQVLDAQVTTQLGDLLLIDPTTGATQRIALTDE